MEKRDENEQALAASLTWPRPASIAWPRVPLCWMILSLSTPMNTLSVALPYFGAHLVRMTGTSGMANTVSLKGSPRKFELQPHHWNVPDWIN